MLHKSRKIFAGFCVLAGALVLCLGAPGNLRTNVTLQWDKYPTNQISPDLILKVYSSTNLAIPLSSWPLVATVNPTNVTVTLPIDAHQRFYVMTASNWWGESDFGNVASTPAPPRSDLNLRIGL